MDNTIIQQGSFTSDGTTKTIQLRSDLDWMMVYNTTQGATPQTVVVGVKYYWQRGFPAGAKWVTFKSNAANAANLEQYIEANGFTLVDNSLNVSGVLISTITAISNAGVPVVTNTGVNGLVAGDVVRLIDVTGVQQFGGFDFTVGINTLSNTTFSLDFAPQIVAGTNGSWRKIPFDPLFYPPYRFISEMEPFNGGNTTALSMTVRHQFTVGQQVRFVVPAAYGMAEMNGLLGTIIEIQNTGTDNLIRVDIDSSSFTPFAWPLTADVPFSAAMVVPVGEDTAFALSQGQDILADATVNTGYIGIQLKGGASNPGGADNDVLYWQAGKSFSVDNE